MKRNNKKTICLAITITILTSNIFNTILASNITEDILVLDENINKNNINMYTLDIENRALSIPDQNRMLGAVAREWESSNLREWLNTETSIVNYTGIEPSYKDEEGFLSNKNFTVSERDGIAITKHGGAWQYSISNTNATKYISQRSVAHNDYLYNDKVFILNYTDLVNYIERNNQLLNLNTKNYSNYLKSTTNKQDKYPYIVNSGYVNSAYAGTNQMYSSTLTTLYGKNQNNIVPALSLKPNYVLSSGTKASDLKVGQIVNFGKYNGENIEWQVINKSNNGYPLLWATKILMIKEYDVGGDINPLKSNYINFTNYDIDIASGTGQNRSWETQETVLSTPIITIVNESALTTPTNDTSIMIEIKVTDKYNTIRKITLPDGTFVNGDTAYYTIKQNGEFDILAENSQGVLTVRHIVTKAINTPAEVNIKTDKDESTKWTNKPVNVTISASNNGVYKQTTPIKTSSYGGVTTAAFPTWMPLGGKRVRITGTVYNKITDEDIQNYNLNMNSIIRFRGNYTQYTISTLSPTYPIIKEISLAELKRVGQIDIDEIYIMPNNVYNNFRFSINLMDSNSDYMRTGYNWGVSSFNYEILDKDDLKIEEITLPNGNIIKNDTASYTITQKGLYTFSVKDNRGKITSKSIDVDIDMVKPTLTIDYPTSYTNNNLSLKINATDDLSGIKHIKLPNGEVRQNTNDGLPLSLTYNILTNGSYTFEISDFAGNIVTQTIQVKNIDKSAPTGTYTLSNSSWTNQDLVITVVANDNGLSGVKRIKLPNGTYINSVSATYTISTNGTYNFVLEDNLGNVATYPVTITNIDKTNPTGSFTINNGVSQTNDRNVTLKINYSDNLSGLSKIVVAENGVSKEYIPTSSPFTTSWVLSPTAGNKTFHITLYDKAGNAFYFSGSINYTSLEIQNFILTNVVNPKVFNNNNSFIAKVWPYSPQPMSAGGNISFQVMLNNPIGLPNYIDMVTYRLKLTHTNGYNVTLSGTMINSNNLTYQSKVMIPKDTPKGAKVEIIIIANRMNSYFNETIHYPSKDSNTTYAHIGNITNNINEDIKFNEIK